MKRKFIDLEGMIFGNWKVIKYSGNINKQYFWLCECQCSYCKEYSSIIKDVQENNLKNGKTKSCGRLSRYLNGKNNKKYNTYDLTGEYGIGYAAKGEEFYFDLEDYDKIKDYCWCVFKDTNNSYLRTCLDSGKKHKYIFLHNMIFEETEEGYEVDHINGITYDNRKSNLRCVSHLNNMKNTESYSNNTSGTTGVAYSKSENKWKSYITYNKKRIHLGTFENKNDAILARLKAEKKYFNEFSCRRNLEV